MTRIGTAGWAIPGRYSEQFGAGVSTLARYATRFNAVEINTTFYKVHKPSTFARWAAAVPDDFRFSLKMPRQITHELALRNAEAALDRFLAQISPLGDKTGCLLLQLSPSLVFLPRQVSAFLSVLRARTDLAMACEPRHVSWFAASANALMARYRVDRVGADPARVDGAAEPVVNARLCYRRLHGSPRTYYSAYQSSALGQIAQRVEAADARTEHWVIFDNTAHGFATENALALRALEDGIAQLPG